jgi:hypothetical protein
MKKIFLVAVALIAISAMAQQSTPAPQSQAAPASSNIMETSEAPTPSDLYCSGFISKENYNPANQVTGGEDTPAQTLIGGRGVVLVSGSGYQEGQEYTVLRALRDPNLREQYKGQHGDIASLGQPYAQLGRVRIAALRGTTAVAEIELSCQPMTTGDILIPFQERQPMAYRKATTMERFPAGTGKVGAKIVMSSEFDLLLGRGQKVYLNVGSDKGIKVGDYFRAVRGYDPDKIEPVEALSYKSPVGDDTQKNPGKVTKEIAKKLPERNLGEMIVLNVTPTSSTAMITNSLESIEVGDHVELEGEQ